MMTDPIADLLTRIRNAGMAKHAETRCPASKLKKAIAEVMKSEGFLTDVQEDTSGTHPALVITLRYSDDGKPMADGIRRVSTPGRRVYVGAKDIKRVRNGLGISILSTSKGVISDREARAQSLGGELRGEVW